MCFPNKFLAQAYFGVSLYVYRLSISLNSFSQMALRGMDREGKEKSAQESMVQLVGIDEYKCVVVSLHT